MYITNIIIVMYITNYIINYREYGQQHDGNPADCISYIYLGTVIVPADRSDLFIYVLRRYRYQLWSGF